MREKEKTWAILVHLTVLLNLFTLILGMVAALVIYLVHRTRAPLVAFHSLQALLMQLVVWLGGLLVALAAWLASGALTASIIGICLMPVAFLLSLVPIIAVGYGILGAIEVSLDRDFRYYRAADWALKLMNS